MPEGPETPDTPSSAPPPPPAAPPPPSVPPPPPAQAPPPPSYSVTTSEWRNLGGLKTALTWLLALNALSTVFVVLALLKRLGTLDDLEDRGFTFDTIAKDEDARDLVLSSLGLFLLLALVTGIVFIVWFFRAAKNSEALGRQRPRFGAGWAIGGWFIPLANLVIPVLIAQDLWRGSDPSVPRGDDRWRIAPRSALVGWWWALLIVSRVSLFIGRDDTNENERISAIRGGINGSLVAQVLTVAAAVLAILVVRRITERQEECLRTQQEAWRSQTGTPPPGLTPG